MFSKLEYDRGGQLYQEYTRKQGKIDDISFGDEEKDHICPDCSKKECDGTDICPECCGKMNCTDELCEWCSYGEAETADSCDD